ncbi:MAG: sialate O-acetylesterase [Pirellulales bacterium]
MSLKNLSRWLCLGLVVSSGSLAQADVTLPNIFTDHMVLQQGQKNKVWGKAEANEAVTVTIGSQSHKTTAGSDGMWHVMLDPLTVGGPLELTVAGKNQIKITDVLVGEVWVCSGQSNMQWSVNASNDPDLEKLAAKFPKIRMINFPQVGTQTPIWTHDRKWMVCTPENVGNFSAVGYFFARQLHQSLDVPIGMINNAWGGSACEAWISRETFKQEPRFNALIERWSKSEADYEALAAAPVPTDEKEKEAHNKRLQQMKQQMTGNSRPANIYNGVLKSHLGYGIKGAIWYQGESNAGRAYQYRELFPLMIKSWRKEWGQGDFPFYWVQLADFREEKQAPADSDWAELREAQTMTMSKLPNTGEAVIIDIGEGKDIHPKNKVDVGRRLARWALAKDYGISVPYHSPQYKSMEKDGNKIVLSFDYVDGWRPFDVAQPRGFTIAGEDKVFRNATATITKDNKVVVTSPEVANPVAVRYAWADNPICNMFANSGLPLTPFRTDEWPGVTIDKE